ncbi:MAG: hypothetical protein ABJC05_09850 [Pyrinomonadaceae bacterium]
MSLIRRVGDLSAVLGLALFLSACPASRTTISQINANPAKYTNKEVGIVGKVTDSYGVLGSGAYEIDDGTGRLWVATTRGVPSRGARVGVSGHLHTGFNYGGRSYGTIIEETGRRSSKQP